MSFEPKLSRFSVLPDDVSEPIGKKSSTDKTKKKKAAGDQKGKGGPGGDASKKKGSGAKGKSLKSLAFGSASEGKKKAANNNNSQSAAQKLTNGNQINGAKRPSAQWDDWQKRDSEIVDEVYEIDLEAALVQSQVDFQNELARMEAEKAAGKSGKGKKKGITVPLNEFNSMLLDNPKPEGPNMYPDVADEVLIERFRAEAKQQLEKEKEMAQQRELLAKRQAEGVYKHPHSKERAKDVVEVDEQTRTIENLRAENELLKSELDSYKSRLKKVHDIFQGAQELKDKAKLIFQVENLTKIQEDLQEQVQELHSQLEQERSKSHAAINEHRKLMNLEQSRRRTNTEAST